MHEHIELKLLYLVYLHSYILVAGSFIQPRFHYEILTSSDQPGEICETKK